MNVYCNALFLRMRCLFSHVENRCLDLSSRSYDQLASPFTFLATYLAVMSICTAWVSSEISIKCVGASRSSPPLPFFIMRSCYNCLGYGRSITMHIQKEVNCMT